MRGMVWIWRMAVLAALCLPAMAAEPWDALRQGGVVVLMRHAATEPGTGDPPGFVVADCSTQRNLSAQGRAQARRFGALFAARGVRPVALFSSAWCRCLDTSVLAFPSLPVEKFPALDSLFMNGDRASTQTAALRDAIGRISPSGVTVWVTHQRNATALTGEYLGMGEALVLRPDAGGDFSVIGRVASPER